MKLDGCGFCELAPDDPRVIQHGPLTVSFLSNPRITEGHSLVVPRRHLEDLDQLTTQEMASMYREARRIGKLLLSVGAQGFDIWQKYRPEVVEGTGVKMNHLHLHVLPSVPGQELYDTALRWGGDAFKPLEPVERDALVPLLRPAA